MLKELSRKIDVLPDQENALRSLPYATDALFNSYARRHEPTCRPNTRVDILQNISQWADSDNLQCLFWLSGIAGAGKSTIAHTIARDYFEQGRLAASFFFSRGGGDASNASHFVTTIALQLQVIFCRFDRIYMMLSPRILISLANPSQISGVKSFLGHSQS
jgi:hypothetical protein